MISLLLKFSTEKSESRTVYWPLAVCRGSNYNPRQIQCKFSSVHVKQSNKNHHQYVRAGQSPPLPPEETTGVTFCTESRRCQQGSCPTVPLRSLGLHTCSLSECGCGTCCHWSTSVLCSFQCGTLTHRGVRGQCEDGCWRWLELTRTSSESPALSGPVATHHCHNTSQVVSTSGRQGPLLTLCIHCTTLALTSSHASGTTYGHSLTIH